MYKGEVGQIINIIARAECTFCVLRMFERKTDFFTYPIASSAVNIHAVHMQNPNVTVAPLGDCLKCILLPMRDGTHIALRLCSADALL